VPTQQDAALPNFLSNFYACGRESAVCLEESVVLAAKSGWNAQYQVLCWVRNSLLYGQLHSDGDHTNISKLNVN